MTDIKNVDKYKIYLTNNITEYCDNTFIDI